MKIVPENVKEIYIAKFLSLWVFRYFLWFSHIISSSWDVVSQGVHSVATTQLHLLRCRAGPCAVKVPCAMPSKNFWRTQWEGMRGQTCRGCRSRMINMDTGKYQQFKGCLPFSTWYCFVSMLNFHDVQYNYCKYICLTQGRNQELETDDWWSRLILSMCMIFPRKIDDNKLHNQKRHLEILALVPFDKNTGSYHNYGWWKISCTTWDV